MVHKEGMNGDKSEASQPTQRGKRDRKTKTESGKLSLYPLSIEDALRAAARGPLPDKPERQNRARKKPAAPG
jgi:hypothetical protein